MRRSAVWFTAPEQVQVREESLDSPGEGQVLVQTQVSAISPGTELLFYHGLVPEELQADSTIAALRDSPRFPFKYGYACAGCVIELGADVSRDLLGQRVFCFHPHESAFLARPEELIPIPDAVDWENAVFLPNMETAVNFCMDAAPRVAETAAVFGLGIVGLLTCAILAQYPLALLIGFDPLPHRRRLATNSIPGLVALDPSTLDPLEYKNLVHQAGSPDGLDLGIECSGSPQALNQAIQLAGFESRVIIGSWYGKKIVPLELGGAFHRSRIRLVSSQVSTIASEWGGRWSKARRLGAAWAQIQRIQPARWITHRFPIAAASSAYALLADNPGDAVQVLLEYPA
jgi:2-desacetyl-2-hydroxyethyl bacteriochlorophyllide A dehydrogenase